jgi:methanogenic corrinoid protein MtbC1/DNA-binding XRE family transcriptional regulator
MSDFATRLRELRKRQGLRQFDLGQALGVAQTTIANYEKKLRFPDEQMLGRFADFFGVSLDFLLGRSDAKRRIEDARPVTQREASPAVSGMSERYLGLLRTGQIEAALDLVETACRTGIGVREIYLDVMEPALKETGRLWERGELSVGEEHAISEATQRIMSRIFRAPGADRPGAVPPRCLALAVTGEQHVIGLRMVSDLLRLDGWHILFPGGNLSIGHVIELLARDPPDLLAISVTNAEHVAGAEDLIAVIRQKALPRTLRIMAGGQALVARPELWQEIGADGTAGDAASAVAVANGLVGRTPPADESDAAPHA